MKIGIIGAMDEEITAIKLVMNIRSEKTIAGNIFYSGKLFGKDCVLVKSGVGKVFGALTSQILISEFRAEKIIFTGLAGSIKKELKIGDIVVGERCVQYDLDASELGFKIGQIPYTDYRFFYGDKKMIDVALKTKIDDTKIKKGVILTGDMFQSKKEKGKHKNIFEELNGDCLEMEGAAVAQVCTLNKVPFCIIRIISDNADDGALSDFEKFKNIVANKSSKMIEALVKNEGC